MVSKIFRAISSSRIRHLEPQGAGNDPNPILCAARISLTASAWAWGISESSPLAVPNNSRDRSRPPPPLRSVFRLRLTPPPRQVPRWSTPPPAGPLGVHPPRPPCRLPFDKTRTRTLCPAPRNVFSLSPWVGAMGIASSSIQRSTSGHVCLAHVAQTNTEAPCAMQPLSSTHVITRGPLGAGSKGFA